MEQCVREKKVLLTPNEQKLYAELTPQIMPETDRLIDAVLAIYRKFNLFDGVKHEKKRCDCILQGHLPG